MRRRNLGSIAMYKKTLTHPKRSWEVGNLTKGWVGSLTVRFPSVLPRWPLGRKRDGRTDADEKVCRSPGPKTALAALFLPPALLRCLLESSIRSGDLHRARENPLHYELIVVRFVRSIECAA